MRKRVTLLERKATVPPADFSAHWSGPHATIAVNLPGLMCYRQNHVTRSVRVPADGDPYRVDGIVELWFTGTGEIRAGLISEVTDRLVADEPRFLSGLTGGRVDAPASGPVPAVALWILACWGGAPDRAPVETWARSTTAEIGGLVAVTINVLEPGEPLLLRAALRNEEMPEVLIELAFADQPAAERAIPVVAAAMSALETNLRRVQLLASTVVSIVERPANSPQQ